MAIFAATSVSDIVDELVTSLSLGDREDRQMLVKTLRRRFPEETRRTDIILIDCRAFRDPSDSALRNHWGVHPTTLSKILNHRKFPGLLLELVERVMRFADRGSPSQGPDWLHLYEGTATAQLHAAISCRSSTMRSNVR